MIVHIFVGLIRSLILKSMTHTELTTVLRKGPAEVQAGRDPGPHLGVK